MRPGSLIIVSFLISSTIAIISFTNQYVSVPKSGINVMCGPDVYPAPELRTATIRGCKLLMPTLNCWEGRNCFQFKKSKEPKEYTGPGFYQHEKDIWVWELPMREGSEYVSDVIFDIDQRKRECMTLGASFRHRDGGNTLLCKKIKPQSYDNYPNSDSASGQQTESPSPPGRRLESQSPPPNYRGSYHEIN